MTMLANRVILVARCRLLNALRRVWRRYGLLRYQWDYASWPQRAGIGWRAFLRGRPDPWWETPKRRHTGVVGTRIEARRGQETWLVLRDVPEASIPSGPGSRRAVRPDFTRDVLVWNRTGRTSYICIEDERTTWLGRYVPPLYVEAKGEIVFVWDQLSPATVRSRHAR